MVFQVSPPSSPVPGVVDEIRWLVFTFAPAQSLPAELQPTRTFRFGFDARGEPTTDPKVEYVGIGSGQ